MLMPRVSARPAVRRNTIRAPAFHQELDFVLAVTRRQPDLRLGGYRIQTKHLTAITAFKVRVGPDMHMRRRVEPPDAILTGNFVRQSMLHQPFEDPVDGHPVNSSRTINTAFQLLMRQRPLSGNQRG